MFVARKSNHIQEDIKRNWSSWNFGQEGFNGTEEELNIYLESSTDERPVWVSGFDIYPSQIKEFSFGELYPNYWVAIDSINALNGLSCVILDSETLQDAIEESKKEYLYSGDGDSFDATKAILVYSNNDIHIFNIK